MSRTYNPYRKKFNSGDKVIHSGQEPSTANIRTVVGYSNEYPGLVVVEFPDAAPERYHESDLSLFKEPVVHTRYITLDSQGGIGAVISPEQINWTKERGKVAGIVELVFDTTGKLISSKNV